MTKKPNLDKYKVREAQFKAGDTGIAEVIGTDMQPITSFVEDLTNWNIDEKAIVLNVAFQPEDGSRDWTKIFTLPWDAEKKEVLVDDAGNVLYHEKSNIYRYIQMYGHSPKEGDKVKYVLKKREYVDADGKKQDTLNKELLI